jgi:hypothetical protein
MLNETDASFFAMPNGRIKSGYNHAPLRLMLSLTAVTQLRIKHPLDIKPVQGGWLSSYLVRIGALNLPKSELEHPTYKLVTHQIPLHSHCPRIDFVLTDPQRLVV